MKKPEEATPNYLLRNMRESQGWTQEELAEKIGTTGVTISRWESGVTFPSRYFRKRLSTLYGKSIQELGLLQEDIDDRMHEEQEIVVALLHAPEEDLRPKANSLARQGSVFLFNEPLPGPEELYDRKSERDILVNRSYRKASTSIIGPRRSGKTWLVKYLQYVAVPELGKRFSIKYLDATMPSCGTVNGFVAEVLEEFQLSFKSQHGLLALEKGLKTLKVKNIVPVLCIDEFEGFGNREEFTLDFFRALRAMTQKFDLVLVTVSRSPLSTIVGKDVETSGFFNIFEPLTLEPFGTHEASEFIQAKGKQANFTEQEYQCMWRYGEESEGEWPPLRLQLVGKMLLADRGQSAQDPEYWQKFEQRLEDVYRGVVIR